MSQPAAPVIFSDVHFFRDAPAGDPAEVAQLRRLVVTREAPLVLCSTGTRAEIEWLQRELDFRYPFICESGAAVYVPEGYFGGPVPNSTPVLGYDVVTFGPPYERVVDALRRTAKRLGIPVAGFFDLSIEDVAMECGLSLPQARLAKMREYGEPFRIAGSHAADRPRLFHALRRQRLGCAPGGLYDHVGAPVDEVAGIDLLCECYERAFGRVATVGVGDPLRDGRLLSRMQVPIACRRETGLAEFVRKPQTSEFDTTRPARWRDLLRLVTPVIARVKPT